MSWCGGKPQDPLIRSRIFQPKGVFPVLFLISNLDNPTSEVNWNEPATLAAGVVHVYVCDFIFVEINYLKTSFSVLRERHFCLNYIK